MSNISPIGPDASPVFAVEIEDITAGLALRERSGFRFVAADERFRLLDGSKFRRVAQIEAAGRRLLQAANDKADHSLRA